MNITYGKTAAFFIHALGIIACASGSSLAQSASASGEDPLAPTTANFLRAINIHAKSHSRMKGYEIPHLCVRANSTFNENADGPGDMGAAHSPGLAVYTVPLKSGSFGTTRTEVGPVIERLTELTRAGYLAKKNISLVNTLGNPSPAVEFTMTKEGWLHGNSGCFSLGGKEEITIVSVTRIAPDPKGVVAYDVKYTVGLRNFDAWATEPGRIHEIRQKIGSLADQLHTVRLYLGKRGWLPASLTGAIVEAGDPVLDLSIDEIVPPINAGIIKDTISSLKYKACLTLPVIPGEDAVELNDGVIDRTGATYLDGTKAYPETDRHKAWRRRLDGLAKAGLFLFEKLPANPVRNRPAGVRYTLSDQYAPYLDRTGSEKGCLNLGSTELDMVKEPSQFGLYLKGDLDRPFKIESQFVGLAKIAESAWSRSVDMSAAPEVVAMLKDGFVIDGRITANEGKWTLEQGEASRPRMMALKLYPRKRPVAPIEELAPKATEGTEVHIVSTYGANNEPIDVEVTRTGKPIILVLGSYDKSIWRVSLKPGVNVKHVVLMGQGTAIFKKRQLETIRIPAGLPYSSNNLKPVGTYGSIGIAEIEQLFGRRPDSWQMAYKGVRFVVEEVGVIGEVKQPEETHDSVLAKLDLAVKAKVLRRATISDAAKWIKALKKKYDLQNLPPPNIPPDLNNAYVVLKKFTYPDGLYGGNSATFYIPQGVPMPAGKAGHSRVYDLNSISLECSLASACGKEMTEGTLGAGSTQSSFSVDSGGAVNMAKALEPKAVARRQAAPAASKAAPLASSIASSTSNSSEKIFEPSAAAGTQGAELHAIGVYEGRVNFGKEVEDPSASTITVNVRSKGKPVVLALFSYDPVMWNIIPEAGVVLKEVILSGYTQAKVKGVDGKIVRVTPQFMGLAYDNPTAKIAAPILMKYTGLSLSSFQVKYKGTEFVVGSE